MLSHFQRIHLLNGLQLKWSNYFLRVIPTLTHYSSIIPAIPSGSTYWIVILAFCLTFFLANTLTFFLASIVTYFLANMLTSFLTFYLASILTFFRLFWHSILAFYLAFYLTFYSGILSGIYLDILSDMNGASARSEWAVPTCPLGSGARNWGPAVPTEIWSSRLRSSSARWDM